MSESDSNEAPTPAKKSRRSFTAEKKLEIVAYANPVSINAASTKYKVDRKNIRDWKSGEKKLKDLW
jgi:transposase-like protein